MYLTLVGHLNKVWSVILQGTLVGHIESVIFDTKYLGRLNTVVVGSEIILFLGKTLQGKIFKLTFY